MNNNLIDQASEQLLFPFELKPSELESLLGQAMHDQASYADIYMQYAQSESWLLEQGIIKEGCYSAHSGFGFRLISQEKTGFAYADGLSLKALKQAVSSVKSIASQGEDVQCKLPYHHHAKPSTLYAPINPLSSLSDQDKVAMLWAIDQKARSQDGRVKQVMVQLSGCYEVILMVNHQGVWAADIRPLVSLSTRVIAQKGPRKEQGFTCFGGRYGYVDLQNRLDLETYVGRAVNQALMNLESIPTPALNLPVVLGSGWPGILLHEAVGHGLEGDFNRKGSSAFAHRMGQKVANEACTIVDDGTLEHCRGSLSVDDEGVPAQCTTLIEKGILKSYMQDQHNAQLMKTQSTGNGRRESYAHRPIPRMTNTYMLPGTYDPQEIIASVKKGIYAVDFSGGQVDITSGKFVFSMSEAYLIEQGKITAPLSGATIIGDGPTVLTKISMVGNDLALDQGMGTCAKAGQSVAVGVGQPTLRVDELLVGGSEISN